jgi:hypothetical protein
MRDPFDPSDAEIVEWAFSGDVAPVEDWDHPRSFGYEAWCDGCRAFSPDARRASIP